MQYQNILADLARIAKVAPIPEFVKQASLDEVAPDEPPDRSLCADLGDGSLPCHTRAATWMSAARYALDGKHHPIIMRKLAAFARMHGIEDEVAAVLNGIRKVAVASRSEPFYAYEDPDTGLRAFPIPSPRFVKRACDLFLSEFGNMPFRVRHEVARNILKRAEELGTALEPDHRAALEKSAALAVSARSFIAAKLRDRARLIRTTRPDRVHAIADRLDKLAGAIEDEGMDRDSLVKLAELVDTLDRKLDITVFGPVEETFFALSPTAIKEARAHLVKLADGSVLVDEELERLNLRKVAMIFGEDVARSLRDGLRVDVNSARRFAESLPPDQAALFLECISQDG